MARRRSDKSLGVKAAEGVGEAAEAVGDKTVDKIPPASPNPMTNLVLTDILLRSGGQFMRHAVERTLLRTTYDAKKAKDIVKGRSMAQTIVATALARMATRSVPGAILVGGGLLAKTLYDRRHGPRAAKAEGERAIRERLENAEEK
ncbi:MAG: hypothetical protein LC648_02605 [Novosphingobium sp.]|nr:hypothetical protein [Novosphingobium sp.]